MTIGENAFLHCGIRGTARRMIADDRPALWSASLYFIDKAGLAGR